MYYLLVGSVTSRRTDPIEAFSVDSTLCTKLAVQSALLDEPLMFIIPPSAQHFDFFAIGGCLGCFLASSRFFALLQTQRVEMQHYAASLIHETSGVPLSVDYTLVVPIKVPLRDCLDFQKSQLWTDEGYGQRLVTTFVANETYEKKAIPLFCASPKLPLLIHERLRQPIEQAHLKGMVFVPTNAFFLPIVGPYMLLLEKKAAKQPSDAQVWYELATTYKLLFHYDKALQALEQALTLNPQFADAWHVRGMIFQALHQYGEALAAYYREMTVSPLHSGWYDYCLLLQELGHPQEALQLAQHYVKDDFWKQGRPAWYTLAMAYRACGQHEEALTTFRYALTLHGNPMYEIYLVMAQLLQIFQRYEEALATLEQGLSLVAAYLPFWQEKVTILHRLGREDEEKTAKQKVDQLEGLKHHQMTDPDWIS